MDWPPAVVIVVRHGARLDAADKQWHLTSPTPYDPPLTYGGWTQSRALGARIASILRSRETDDEIPVAEGGQEQNGVITRKRRHKVIIHTSPFLRCVQTSVAISAGLAQIPGHTPPRLSTSVPPALKATQMHSSPKIRPTIYTGSPALAPISEPPSSVSKSNGNPRQHESIKKSTIRVDAFLGEWLSPDYFELITPPPSSLMMVAGAKADLLRREDYSNLALSTRSATSAASNVGFPGGWGSPVVHAEKDKDDGPLSSLTSLGQALSRRDRTSSLSSVGSNVSRPSARSSTKSTELPITPEDGAYQHPVPNYAISSSDPIPSGYVPHARDACVDVDYQWDSMREPQEWGNGGEYGEEWSAMHKRFRNGLQQMIAWYQNNDEPGKLLTKVHFNSSHGSIVHEVDPEDDDTDLVIILVTHGAGCNALIGALTHQPVLLDVGMASLTMAVRKPTPVNSPTTTPGTTPKNSRRSSRNYNVSDQYDVKLVANTDHLRSTSSTPSTSRGPSVAGVFREKFGSGTSSDTSALKNPTRAATTNPNFGSIRRTASVAGSKSRSYVPSPQSSVGLWSAPQVQQEEKTEEADDMILNFGDHGVADSKNGGVTETALRETKAEDKAEDSDGVPPLGLWGSPRPPSNAEKIREVAPKRRWTVNERG